MLQDISNGIQSLVNYFNFLFYELHEGISDFGDFGSWLSDLRLSMPTFMLGFIGSGIAILCFNKFFKMK